MRRALNHRTVHLATEQGKVLNPKAYATLLKTVREQVETESLLVALKTSKHYKYRGVLEQVFSLRLGELQKQSNHELGRCRI